MKSHSLNNVALTIRQMNQSDPINYSEIRSGIVEELLIKSDRIIENKDSQIVYLKKQLQNISLVQYPIEHLAKEAHAIDSRIESLSAQTIVQYNVTSNQYDTTVIAILKSKSGSSNNAIIKKWLSERLNNQNVQLFITQ
ncbi:MAG: hypothetical protein ACO30P_02475 [Candidatus Kapaibacteriota bacterium]